MDEINELPNHLFISLRYQFKATRVIDFRLSPTTVNIKVDISTLDDDTDDYAVRMDVALAKLNYFVENVLKGIILISAENDWALTSFIDGNKPATSNNVMLCPEEPTDALLCEILLSKFKAITQDAFDFHAIDVESTDSNGMGFTFVGSTPGSSFPSMDDWIGERTYFTKPWWHRADASTLDAFPDEDDDLNQPPSWAYSLGFIAEQIIAPSNVPNNVVVRPEFRPKVIDGGKAD